MTSPDETPQDAKKTQKTSDAISETEWKRRRLCRDESCIGVIGPDGRCKECGLPDDGAPISDPDHIFAADTADTADTDMLTADLQEDADDAPLRAGNESDDDMADEAANNDPDNQAQHPDDEWARRRLCRDESCIGVIGPGGRCKECGLPWKSGKTE